MKTLSAGKMTAYYLVALTIIAILSISSHITQEHVLRTNKGSAAVINLSGRQRMLSQRIASMAAQYRLGNPVARTDLLAAVTSFEEAHQRLTLTLPEAGIGDDGDDVELHALYFDGSGSLDNKMREFTATARRVAALPPDDPAMAALLSSLFADARGPVLSALDEAVSIHQRESEHTLEEVRQIQWAILAIVMMTLVLEAVAIFRPMIRRIVIYTGELVRLATIDPLTNADNRRSFFEKTALELKRMRRYERPSSVLMLDIDHFKRINDTYGHAAGDEVLKVFAATLSQSLRPGDVLGRLGGEEFAIFPPETLVSGAAGLAERLRTATAGLVVPSGESWISFTVSIGVAQVGQIGDQSGGVDEALKRADSALYRAKEGGRNRVVVEVSSQPMPGQPQEATAAARG